MASVLVVDDNPTNLRLMAFLLESAGHLVISAKTADHALQLAHERRPDLILMDIQLPGIDGLEATRRLKRDPATRPIPVIAITAFAMKGDEAPVIAAGCDGYLVKPFRREAFLAAVQSALAATPGAASGGEADECDDRA